jgi:hypothetical protein
MIIRFAGYRSRFILVMAVAVFLPIMPMRAEAEDSPAYEFLKRVACGLLELDIQCDFLSAENARNTLNAYLALLSQKLCGSINRGEAKQLLEIGDALKPKECKELLDLTE